MRTRTRRTWIAGMDDAWTTANTERIGQSGQRWDAQSGNTEARGDGKANRIDYDNERWQWFPTQPPVCGRNDELSGRLDGITFSKWRQESIKAYGNAIVPQVALQIFKAIEQYEAIK